MEVRLGLQVWLDLEFGLEGPKTRRIVILATDVLDLYLIYFGLKEAMGLLC